MLHYKKSTVYISHMIAHGVDYFMIKQDKIKIFYLGSGAFSVPVLEALTQDDRIELAGIGTQIDKAAGRKRILTPTPLGKWCDEHNIPCMRVPSVNAPDFLDMMRKIAPDIVVVVSFGQLLKVDLLNIPKFGCFNVHASLLPAYRGASPIATAVLNGDAETGVAFMQMEKGLDTGPVYELHRLPIPDQITTGELEQVLARLAGEKIGNCLVQVAEGLKPVPQGESGVSIAVKIRKTDGAVDFREDAAVIARKIRAFYGWPSMTFRVPVKGRTINVKIMRAKCTSWESPQGQPGEFIAYTNNQMMIRCGKGALLIERVLPEGKKEMSVADFLNGCHVSIGDILLNGMDDQN